MAHNGFGKYLPGEPTDAEKRRTPGYVRGFGRHIDGSQDAVLLKRQQLATLRRQRIRDAINAGTCEFGRAGDGRTGEALDPLRNDPDAIEAAWRAEFAPDDGDAA